MVSTFLTFRLLLDRDREAVIMDLWPIFMGQLLKIAFLMLDQILRMSQISQCTQMATVTMVYRRGKRNIEHVMKFIRILYVYLNCFVLVTFREIVEIARPATEATAAMAVTMPMVSLMLKMQMVLQSKFVISCPNFINIHIIVFWGSAVIESFSPYLLKPIKLVLVLAIFFIPDDLIPNVKCCLFLHFTIQYNIFE